MLCTAADDSATRQAEDADGERAVECHEDHLDPHHHFWAGDYRSLPRERACAAKPRACDEDDVWQLTTQMWTAQFLTPMHNKSQYMTDAPYK